MDRNEFFSHGTAHCFKMFRITKLMKFVGTQENTGTIKDVMVASYGDVEIRVARNPSALGARAAGIVTNRCNGYT